MATGVDALSIARLLEQVRLGNIITEVRIYWAVCAAILFWEFIITLGAEYNVVWKKQWSPLKVLYIMNRYFALIWMTIQLVSYSMDWNQEQCWHFFKFQIFGLLTIMTICETILIARVAALYDNNKLVIAGFAVWMLVQTSYCAALCGLTKPDMLVEGEGPCVMLRPFPWFFTCFCWHAAFDTLIIVATLAKTRKLQDRVSNSLVDRIHNDGQLYYLALVSTNIFNIIPMAIPGVRDRPMINVPLSAITTTIMCTRLVLRLRQTASTQSFPSLTFTGVDRPAKGMTSSTSTGSSSSGGFNNLVHVNDPTRSWRSGSTVVSGSIPLSPCPVKFHYTVYDEEKASMAQDRDTKSGVMIATETEVEVSEAQLQERQLAESGYMTGVVPRPGGIAAKMAERKREEKRRQKEHEEE